MVDCETLGTSQDAAIISIGAVAFDFVTKETNRFRFYSEFKPDLEAHSVDFSTVAFWANQGEEQKRLFNNINHPLATQEVDALSQFSSWVEEVASYYQCNPKLLSYPSTADIVWLKSAYSANFLPFPFAHNEVGCAKSAFMLTGDLGVEFVNGGTPHHALDDALAQAQWLIEFNDKLQSQLMKGAN